MIELRPMTEADLPLVRGWLRQPHVARWWLPNSTADAEIAEYRALITGTDDQDTTMLIVGERRPGRPAGSGTPVGWCQWYPLDAYPEVAAAMGASPGECGIDYAIGDPAAVGRGLGTQLIAALVAEVRRHHPGCGVLVDPEAANAASRRVLERNGFELVAVRPVASEPNEAPMALYRLARLARAR